MIRDRFPQLKGIIVDMDGVLWNDSEPIGDLPRIFASLETQGLQWICATNNATKTPQEFENKLRSFGVKVPAGNVLNTAELAASYLSENYPEHTTVYVVGTRSLKKLISQRGFRVLPVDKEDSLSPTPDIEVVVTALQWDFTYREMRDASVAIRNGADFIGTNSDSTFPTPQGLFPGAGALLASIQAASGEKPLILGKPQPFLYQEALKRMGLKPHQAMGIGDRLSTDIAGAQAAGCLSGFVGTGVSSLAEAQAWQPAIDLVAPDLWSLIHD